MTIDPSNPVIFPFKNEKETVWTEYFWNWLAPVFLFTPVAWYLIVMEPQDGLTGSWFRLLLCGYFAWWGIAYYQADETALRFYIGLFEFTGGIWSNWHQLATFAAPSSPASRYDRFMFVAGGIALMANGVKDIMKGKKTMAKKPLSSPIDVA